MFVTQSVLDQPSVLLSPVEVDGRLVIGPSVVDGQPVHYQLVDPTRGGRVRHGLIVGHAGAGVSSLLTTVCVVARASRAPVSTLYLSGCSVVVNPALAHASSAWIEDPVVADTSIAAVEAAVVARRATLEKAGAATYVETGLPLLLVAVKDAHRVFHGHAQRWVALLRQAGVLGISVLAATHSSRVIGFGGSRTAGRSSSELRDLLMEQVLVLPHLDPMTDALLSSTAAGYDRALTRGRYPGPALRAQLVRDGIATAFRPYQLSAGGGYSVQRARHNWLRAYPGAPLDECTQQALEQAINTTRV